MLHFTVFMLLLRKSIIFLQGGEYNIMNLTKERIEMKSLKDIRNNNKRSDLLFCGMEIVPKILPEEFLNTQKNQYQNVVKPMVERVYHRQINN